MRLIPAMVPDYAGEWYHKEYVKQLQNRLRAALSVMRALRSHSWGDEKCAHMLPHAFARLKEVMSSRDPLHLHCHAGLDGECNWEDCPQNKDGEPKATGRHCPLDFSELDNCDRYRPESPW